ncbi:MAG: hypothetical protein LBU27_02945 [Candidatus Peribacteria bacterium]|nr:hypothetical protein [Candidatus Peribacteria bacterium]
MDKLGYDNMKYNGSNSNISVGNTDTQKKVAQCFQADMNISSDTVNIGCLVS